MVPALDLPVNQFSKKARRTWTNSGRDLETQVAVGVLGIGRESMCLRSWWESGDFNDSESPLSCHETGNRPPQAGD